jgi:hypothetical protein
MESKDTPDHRSLGDLWSEVKGQITGSDIESGYSYLYTWLTNQFGHFMIGFAGTILFGWLLMGGLGLAFSGVDYRWFWPWAGIAVAVVWFVIWLFKEWMVDVASALRDLHFAQRQRRALRNRQTFTEERAGYIWPKRIDWETFVLLCANNISQETTKKPRQTGSDTASCAIARWTYGAIWQGH